MRTEVSNDILDAIHRELAPGETILWADQPDSLRMMRASLWQAGVGAGFIIFILFLFNAHREFPFRSEGGVSWFLVAFMFVFISIPASLLLSPWLAWEKSGRTGYAITNRRALLIVLGRQRVVHSFGKEKLSSFVRREDSNSTGDIVFDSRIVRATRNRTVVQEIGFLAVRNVAIVSGLLTKVSNQLENSVQKPISNELHEH